MKAMENARGKETKNVYGFNPEGLKFGIWIWYTVENRMAWSKGFGHLLGLEEEDEPSFESLIGLMYPDDVRLLYNNLIVVLNDWEPRWFTFRITRDDKSVHTIKCLLEGMPIGCSEETDIIGVCFAM